MIDSGSGERIELLPLASSCITKGGAGIYAKKLDHRIKIFTTWDPDRYFLGVEGDYKAVRADDHKDVYIIAALLCYNLLTEPMLYSSKRSVRKGEKIMERTVKFLKEAGTYYLATIDGDQARVRPFGTVNVFDGKLYIQTGKSKDVSKQIHKNPKVEICAFKDGEWLRVAGELVEDERREAKVSMLDAYPSLQNMYSADDGNTEVFYFKDATATFSSFTHAPEVEKF